MIYRVLEEYRYRGLPRNNNLVITIHHQGGHQGDIKEDLLCIFGTGASSVQAGSLESVGGVTVSLKAAAASRDSDVGARPFY